MAILKKKANVTNGLAKNDDDGGDSFMSRLKGTKAAEGGGFTKLKPGQFEALAFSGGLYEDPATPKQAIWIDYCIVNDDGANEGRNGRAFYNIIDKEGDEANGMPYLVRDLEILGIDYSGAKSIENFAEILGEALDQLCPYVVIDVVFKNGFTNIYLNSVMDNQSQKPDLPDQKD